MCSSDLLPVFLGLNFLGNQSTTDDRRVPLTPSLGHIEGFKDEEFGFVKGRATESSRGIEKEQWPIPIIIERGHAFATFYKGDLDSDVPNVPGGVHAWLARQHGGKAPPRARHRGSIAVSGRAGILCTLNASSRGAGEESFGIFCPTRQARHDGARLEGLPRFCDANMPPRTDA